MMAAFGLYPDELINYLFIFYFPATPGLVIFVIPVIPSVCTQT